MALVPKTSMFTNQDFERSVRIITEHIKAFEKKPIKILAFKRGGLVLGVYLSHALNIPMDVIESSKYDYLAPLVVPDDVRSNRFSEYLIVDDIVDTGETIEEFIKSSGIRNYQIVTLVGTQKFEGQDRIFFPVTKVSNEFVIFPWESIDSSTV